MIKPLFVLQEECEDMTLSFFHGKILTRIKGDWEKIVQFIEIIERKLSGNHLQGANSDEFKRDFKENLVLRPLSPLRL